MADFTILKDKVVGGDQGEGVIIEGISLKESTDREGGKSTSVEFYGTAKTYLKDGGNPGAGFLELPEEITVFDQVKVEGKSVDNKILFNQLNQALDIQPPLEDTADGWERFFEGAENSIYDKLYGAKLYFSAKLPKNSTKTGESYKDYFYNVFAHPKRSSANADTLAAYKAKKAAAEDAKAAVAAQFSLS